MKKPEIPSLQHLARNWHPQPETVQKELVKLVKSPPLFNYSPIYGAIDDLLVWNQSVEEISTGLKRKVSRKVVLENYLEIVQLLGEHFSSITPDFVHRLDRRTYRVDRDVLIPFDPPLIYGLNGIITFPWFSFWRSNPLKDERLSLFVTIVSELLAQDPDLDEACFEIFDFSAPKGKGNQKFARELKVINAREIQKLTPQRVTEMLEVYIAGYNAACLELSGMVEETAIDDPRDDRDLGQPGLFD